MRDLFVDVNCEFDTARLNEQPDPSRYALEQSRHTADQLCADQGARLRTDRAPEVVISSAIRPETGRPITLVATRWPVVAPERVEVHQ